MYKKTKDITTEKGSSGTTVCDHTKWYACIGLLIVIILVLSYMLYNANAKNIIVKK